ncbi:NHL repeat-containing protein [Tunturiibacter gelidoferens]|uniref:Sugar lactone lactonase YvrE n=1 Tax=Tunturiibacter lichenicola TaxID=2051959 RepID=A0A7Y9T4B3_9BACT|nr:NHL repeat-containing protein [Edaphobacter lichenicola]NYF53803.1 sugar lactone lactonase YvrE [Edaphobacter lichenicola]
MRNFQGFFSAAMAGVLACSLAGCGGGSTPTTPPPVTPPPVTPPPVTPPPVVTNPGVSFSGKAMAGSQPIVGGTVQLYAAGTGGNGSASTAMLTSTLTTDAAGAFTVPAGYACPLAASQIYVLVRGGQVGGAVANPAITLASALGACNQIAAASQFVVNEVTTAVTAWGLAQFFGTEGNLGASSTNTQGLANAVATVANLANLTTGTSPGAAFPMTGVSPAAKINAVADLLNNCTATASGCGALFSATTPNGGTAPDNTLDAVLNLVRNPGSNVAMLFGQLPSSGMPFTPVPTAVPADWTLHISFHGGGIGDGVPLDSKAPSGLGVDAAGNLWVATYSGIAAEFSTTGTPLFPTGITGGGLSHSDALAVDPQGNIWIPDGASAAVNGGFGSVTELSSSGQILSGATGYSAGGISYPTAIAIDGNGTVWIPDYGNSRVTLLSSTGQPLSGTNGYESLQFSFPLAVALDSNHYGWVANSGNDTVSKVSADGSQIASFPSGSGPDGIAVDQRGYVWVANQIGNSITELANDGTVVSSGYSDNKASILAPQGIAIDGSGHVWVANLHSHTITELAGSVAASPGAILSPTAGYASDAGFTEAYAIVVDASGNLWVTDFNNGTLTEIVGLATPVKTPVLGPPQIP